jgi:hypothetical protein
MFGIVKRGTRIFWEGVKCRQLNLMKIHYLQFQDVSATRNWKNKIKEGRRNVYKREGKIKERAVH